MLYLRPEDLAHYRAFQVKTPRKPCRDQDVILKFFKLFKQKFEEENPDLHALYFNVFCHNFFAPAKPPSFFADVTSFALTMARTPVPIPDISISLQCTLLRREPNGRWVTFHVHLLTNTVWNFEVLPPIEFNYSVKQDYLDGTILEVNSREALDACNDFIMDCFQYRVCFPLFCDCPSHFSTTSALQLSLLMQEPSSSRQPHRAQEIVNDSHLNMDTEKRFLRDLTREQIRKLKRRQERNPFFPFMNPQELQQAIDETEQKPTLQNLVPDQQSFCRESLVRQYASITNALRARLDN